MSWPRLLACAVGGLLLSGGAVAAEPLIAADGDWAPSIGAGDLQAGAGSDLAPTYESSASQVALDITATAGDGDSWRVDVRRTDADWPAAFTLAVRRTSDGMGSGSINGGDMYLTITESDQPFFAGAGDRLNIGAQLRLGGVSLQVPPGIYGTTLTYTLVDT
ncbi:MAG TPA: hypothetical protein VEI97_06560 [bacterium]|nr:hypothetical protein [bacterium]